MKETVMEYSWLKWAADSGGDPFAIVRARDLAVQLMEQHGVGGWTLQMGGGKDRAGSIRYRRVRGRWDGKPGTMILSGPLMSLWTPEQQRQLILHEIAHARVPDHGHDVIWKNECLRVGARPERLWGEGGETRIPGTWVGTCPGGHPQQRRLRKPRTEYACSRCSPKFDRQYLITWAKEEK